MDAQRSAGSRWALARDLHKETGNLLASTVQQIYGPDAGYVLYNDEWPNGTVSFHLAHAKGMCRLTPTPVCSL